MVLTSGTHVSFFFRLWERGTLSNCSFHTAPKHHTFSIHRDPFFLLSSSVQYDVACNIIPTSYICPQTAVIAEWLSSLSKGGQISLALFGAVVRAINTDNLVHISQYMSYSDLCPDNVPNNETEDISVEKQINHSNIDLNSCRQHTLILWCQNSQSGTKNNIIKIGICFIECLDNTRRKDLDVSLKLNSYFVHWKETTNPLPELKLGSNILIYLAALLLKHSMKFILDEN